MPTFGVLIAVPEPYGSELQAARASFGDPQADAVPPHVTLLPPTWVDPDDAPKTVDHLAQTAEGQPPFTVELSGTGTFRPTSPVVFVQLASGTHACQQLHRAIRVGPLERPLEFDYHPHVTVAHDIEEEALDRAYSELADFRGAFEVAAFQLYEQDPDQAWRPLRTFGFDGQATSNNTSR